jgi:hypothetical protein
VLDTLWPGSTPTDGGLKRAVSRRPLSAAVRRQVAGVLPRFSTTTSYDALRRPCRIDCTTVTLRSEKASTRTTASAVTAASGSWWGTTRRSSGVAPAGTFGDRGGASVTVTAATPPAGSSSSAGSAVAQVAQSPPTTTAADTDSVPRLRTVPVSRARSSGATVTSFVVSSTDSGIGGTLLAGRRTGPAS